VASDDPSAPSPSRRLLQRVLGNSAWQLSADVLSTGLRVTEGFIVAAALGPAALGVFALVVAFTATAFQLLDFRVWEVITKYVVAYRAAGDTAKARAIVRLCIWLDLAVGLAAFALIWLAAPHAVGWFTSDPDAVGYVRFLGVGAFAAGSLGTAGALLRVAGEFRILAIKDAAISALRFGAVVGTLAIEPTVKAVIVPIVVVSIVDGAVSWLLVRHAVQRLGLQGWSREPLATLAPDRPQLVRMFVTTNLSATLKLLQGQADVLLLGWLLPDAAVGQYRLARAVSEVARIPVGGVYFASYPEMARLWATRQHANLRRLVRSLLTIMFGVGALAGAAMVLIAPLLPIVVGPEYEGSVTILRILALATVLEVGSAVLHPLLVAADRAAISLFALTCAVTVELVVLAAVVLAVGVAVAGLAHVAFFVAWMAVMLAGARSADREAARWPTPATGSDGAPS
jgi:O-antigen/teichoic acid export membrane protein